MAIHSIAHLIEAKVRSKGLPLRFSATKLIEGDEPLVKELELTANELDIIDHVTKDLEIALDTDKEAALAICATLILKNYVPTPYINHRKQLLR